MSAIRPNVEPAPWRLRQRTLRAFLAIARAVARRVLPRTVKQNLVRWFLASEAKRKEQFVHSFERQPVKLKDLPPLLDRAAFAGGPILLVSSALSWGGAERQVVTTLRGLAGRGERRVGLLCLRLGQGAEYDFFIPALKDFPGIVRNAVGIQEAQRIFAEAKVKAAPVRAAFAWLPDDVREDIERLTADFLQLRPAIVHAWLDAPSIAAAYAARIAGVPKIIVSGRNLSAPNFAFHRPYMALAYGEIAALPDIVMINNSEAGAADYAAWLGLSAARIEVLRNGVDPSGFAPPSPGSAARLRAQLEIPSAAPIVGSIFRFYDEKRPLLWTAAAGAVASRLPDCHFVIVGTGPLRDEVLERALAAGFGERMHAPGLSSETATFLSLFDVFMLTSRAEGTPNVVLEASLAGVPVVATESGGTAEAIDDGVTGIVVRDDDPAAIAGCVLEILGDPTWRERARSTGPRFVQQRFGVERMIDETLALYRR